MTSTKNVNQGVVIDEPRRRARVREFVDEMTQAYHRLTHASDHLHTGRKISTGLRSIMTRLHVSGPATASQLARARGVSRQFMQRIVSELVARGLAKECANPRHRSSPLIVLSEQGTALVGEIEDAESGFWRDLSLHIDAGDLATASRVMRIIIDRAMGSDKS